MIAHRLEIDGLRALAVVPVLLYHAGFPAFGGGYVGVDVFFVVSGYLITSIIVSELEARTFSLVGFYERRARRLLPALFFVMAACIPFAWRALPSDDMRDFSRSLAAMSVFASNVSFWRESGYFGAASELKPLIHTWSLAIEEQYYLLFPVFILLTWRVGRSLTYFLLGALALLSLALAQWAAYYRPSAAFYLLPTRGWELALGAFVAFYARSRGTSATREALGALGLALIVYSVCAFDETTPYPSLYALVPTFGTALVLLHADQTTATGRFLARPAFVGIGLISYSVYLCHQPLFAFYRHLKLFDPGIREKFLLTSASFALGYATWRFVEKPFRQTAFLTRGRLFACALLGSAFFAAFGLAGVRSQGFASRSPLSPKLAASFSRAKYGDGCFSGDRIHARADWLCRLGDERKPPSFFVFGDSHALSFHPLFQEAALKAGRQGEFTASGGCIPFLGVHALRKDQGERNCHLLNRRVLEHLKKSRPKDLYLIADWTLYTDGTYRGHDQSFIGRNPSDPGSESLSKDAFRAGLKRTVEEYARLGIRTHVVTQAPKQLFDARRIYYRASGNGALDMGLVRSLSVDKSEHARLQSFVADRFKEQPGLRLVPLDQAFCPDEKCPVGDEGGSYYHDDNHLSLYGASKLKDAVQKLLAPTRG